MKGYRCYLMSGDQIQAVQTFECENDVEVILKGWALLMDNPQHPVIEIWEGKRLVAHLAGSPSEAADRSGSVIRLRPNRNEPPSGNSA